MNALERFRLRCMQENQCHRGFSVTRGPQREVFVAGVEQKPHFARLQ
jgi:hypothetical protein